MVTAEHLFAFLHAVADDAHTAMRAGGCQHMNRAFKTVEGMSLAPRCYLKGLVVVVTARVAYRHGELLESVAVDASMIDFEPFNVCALSHTPLRCSGRYGLKASQLGTTVPNPNSPCPARRSAKLTLHSVSTKSKGWYQSQSEVCARREHLRWEAPTLKRLGRNLGLPENRPR
jgi:hypothetical protein